MLLTMTQVADKMEINPEKELSPEELGEFLTNFLSFSSQIEQIYTQLKEIKEKLWRINSQRF